MTTPVGLGLDRSHLNSTQRTTGRLALLAACQSHGHANGRFALMRASSVLSTRAILLNCRLRLAFLDDIKWRREDCERKTLPRAVILNRLATAFLVLLRAMDFGIGRER